MISAALSVIPSDSWTARSLRRAVTAAPRGERAVRSAVVIGGYPWTDLAPEAVGLAFGAFAACRGDFPSSVLTAVNMGRDADTTAAVAGALAGALSGAAAIPAAWSSAIGPVRGSCLLDAGLPRPGHRGPPHPGMRGRPMTLTPDDRTLALPPANPTPSTGTGAGAGTGTPPAEPRPEGLPPAPAPAPADQARTEGPVPPRRTRSRVRVWVRHRRSRGPGA